jgi:Resolvase, N terminal domain
MIVGYARVSTDGQTLDAQQSALVAAGVERVFAEKISGAVTERPVLAKAISALGQGDTLVVTKLDRLARSTRDLHKHAQAQALLAFGVRQSGDTLVCARADGQPKQPTSLTHEFTYLVGRPGLPAYSLSRLAPQPRHATVGKRRPS